MKNKLILTAVLFALSITCFSQSNNFGTISELANNSNGRIVYKSDSLMNLNKLELTNIYLQQVQVLNNILPYASFNIKGQASGVNQIDIPKSKYTNTKRDKVSDKALNYNKSMNENLYEIIPYSDKTEIVKGIIFIQEMINKLDSGL